MRDWKIICDYEKLYWQFLLSNDNVRIELFVKSLVFILQACSAGALGYLVPLFMSDLSLYQSLWMSFLICLVYDIFLRLYFSQSIWVVFSPVIRTLPVSKRTFGRVVLLSLLTDVQNVFVPIWMSFTIWSSNVAGYWLIPFLLTGCVLNMLCAFSFRMSGTVLIRLAVPFLLYAVPFAVGMAGLRVSEMLWWCPFVLYIIWLVALLVGLTVYWLQQTYDESSSDEGKFRLLTSEAGLYDIVCRPLWKGSCKPLLLIALLCVGLCPFSIRMDIFSGVPEEILMLHLLVPFLLVPFLMGNLAFSLQSVFWDCLAVNRSHLAEWLILFKYKVVFVVNALLAVICMLLFWRAAGIMILSIFLFTTGFLPIITFLPHPYDNIRWEFLDRKVKRGTPFVTFVEIVVFVGIYALMKMIEIKAGTDVLLRLMSVIGFVSMIFSPLWLRLIARSCQKQRYYLADGFRGNKEGMR